MQGAQVQSPVRELDPIPNFLHCAKRLEVISLLALQGPSQKLHPFPANKCIPSGRMPPDSLKSMGMKCLCVHKSFKPTKISTQSPWSKETFFRFLSSFYRHFLESLSTCKVIACIGKEEAREKKCWTFPHTLNFHPTSITWFSWSTERPEEGWGDQTSPPRIHWPWSYETNSPYQLCCSLLLSTFQYQI